jgi:hypothetical protein
MEEGSDEWARCDESVTKAVTEEVDGDDGREESTVDKDAVW